MNSRDKEIIDCFSNDYTMTYKRLAEMYNLSFQRVHQIVNNNLSKDFIDGWTKTKKLWAYLQNIEVSFNSDDCWEWTGKLHGTGYGYSNNAEEIHSHRFMYCLVNGDIPKGKVVMHSCDNRKCCNINHLSLGTQKENIQYMIYKERGKNQFTEFNTLGNKNGNSKLLEFDVLNIRELINKGVKQSDIAKLYRVSDTQITNIKKRKQWAHI